MVVRLPVSALNRKLLRDLWQMRSQALAIAMVMAAGVAMYVAYLSNFDSLQRTLTAYYADQRFADVFVSLKRAPERLTTRIRAIEGVEIADTRVVVGVTLDVPGMEEPAAGLLVSVPADARPALNDVFLRSGRKPDVAKRSSRARPFASNTALSPAPKWPRSSTGGDDSSASSASRCLPSTSIRVRPAR
jgi:hypothetical protein